MTATLMVPPQVWAVVMLQTARANPYRYRRETGGWLLARTSDPTTIVAATGPGTEVKSDASSLWFGRVQFSRAVRGDGFTFVGCWHIHPDGGRTNPSPDDLRAWREDLDLSPDRPDAWSSLIVARGADGRLDSGSASAYVTRRDSPCERVRLLPGFDPRMVADARGVSWMIENGSPLLRCPSTWAPGELRTAVAVLEADADLVQRMRHKDITERLRRLGIKTPDLTPIRSPAAVGSSDRSAAGEIIHAGGQTLVRPGIGRVIAVR